MNSLAGGLDSLWDSHRSKRRTADNGDGYRCGAGWHRGRWLPTAQFVGGATRDTVKIEHSSRDAMWRTFFNTEAFVPANLLPLGIYGNVGRGLISGPALVSSDFAVIKDFTFREPFRLQFRSEFFNAFNQVNFNSPNTSRASGSFGRITGAQDGRTIQMALKFLW